MYLFKQDKDNKLEVWTLKPRIEEIIEYKKKEIESIPENKRILSHVAVRRGKRLNSTYTAVTCPHYDLSKDIEGLGYSDCFYYKPVTEESEEIYNAYLNGDQELISETKLFQIVGINEKDVPVSKMYIFGTGNYDNRYRDAVLNNLINIPRSLYILTALESGKLDLIKGLDASEQLKLFDIEFVKTIDTNNLADLIEYGLVPNSIISETQKRLDDSKYVMSFKPKK